MMLHPHGNRTPRRSVAFRILSLMVLAVACRDGRDSADTVTGEVSLALQRGSFVVTLRDSSMLIGDTATVLVNHEPIPRDTRATGSTIRLRSSDPSIVTISPTGVARALRTGKVVINARSMAGSADVTVTVVSTPAPTPPPAPNDTTPAPAPPQAAPPAGGLPSYTAPQLPSAQVSVTPPPAPTRSVRVPAGDAIALQRAIDTARPGDEIVLPNGARFVGTFTLRKRADAGTVVIRSETVPASPGTRMTPGVGSSLASLVATSWYPALTTAPGAQGWRVVGVRLTLANGVADNYGVVTLGSGSETAMSQFPRNITLDRVWVSGNATGNTSRCVSVNGLSLAIIDSWLSDCHANDRDSQAICGWTGVGPILIENNHLEGAGQAIMFGGADPRIRNVVPGDITIRRNHLYKPMSWSGRWLVKAAFELKNAERVLFEGNVIENHWADAQVGFAILLQSVDQSRTAPWSTVRDVTMRNNAIRNSRSGVNLSARENAGVPAARRILLSNNSFENVGTDPVTRTRGIYLQLLNDLEDVTILQNTFFGSAAGNDVMFDLAAGRRLVLSNNVFGAATYGVLGSGYGEGTSSLQHFAPQAVFRNNLITARPAKIYPAGNAFPTTLSTSAFRDAANGDYTLISQAGLSLFNNSRIGVDGTAVLTATSAVQLK